MKIISDTQKKENGFTLVEILVALGVLSIILTAAVAVFMAVNQASEKAASQEKLRYEGLRILDQIGRETQQAKSVAFSASSPVYLRVSFDTEGSNCVQYSLLQPAADVNGFITRCTGTCTSLSTVDTSTCPIFTDNTLESGFDVTALAINVISPPNRPKNVYLTLTLGSNKLVVNRVSAQTEITVQKTVTLRNY